MSARPTLATLVLVLVGCTPPAATAPDSGDTSDATDTATLDTTAGIDPYFHTASTFTSTDQFFDFAGPAKPWRAVKVNIARFSEPGPPSHGTAWFLDPKFYALHDEWYWFRLLNGTAIDGLPDAPVQGRKFATVRAVYDHFANQKILPLDLQFAGDRLYSTRFYDLGLGRCPPTKQIGSCPRFFLLGTLRWLPADPKRTLPDELWLLNLEHPGKPTPDEIPKMLERLAARLPKGVWPHLRWLASTSEYQTALAQTLRAGQWKDHVATWEQLIAPGEVQGYSPGVAAGRLHKLPPNATALATSAPTDVLLVPDRPLHLPPVAAVLTSLPQTPFAYTNLRLVARGTPNAYMAGIFADPVLADWALVQRPVALWVGPNSIRWQALQDSQWEHYQALSSPLPATTTVAPLAGMPAWIEIGGHSLVEARGLEPVVGGSASGLMVLAAAGLELPPKAVALTVAGYAKHMAPLTDSITGAISWQGMHDARVRFMVLEGLDAYAALHKDDAGAMKAHSYLVNNIHPPDVMDVLAHGGVRAWVRKTAVDPAYVGSVTAMLQARFGNLAAWQALRFGSSATVEDLDDLGGAGAYALKPQTVAAALAEVWASYWSFAAFEARRAAGIAHLDGKMAVTVYPDFADDLQEANGVAILAFDRTTQGDGAELAVNVQPGPLSVANQPAGSTALPEIDRVHQFGTGKPTIERVQKATLAPAPILDLAQLSAMLSESKGLASAWLQASDAMLPIGERPQSVLLEMDFRIVLQGWPAQSGPLLRGRRVWTQARPLQRTPKLPAGVVPAPVPKDVLAAAVDARKWTCKTPTWELQVWDLTTDSVGAAIVGWPLDHHKVRQFAARVRWQRTAKVGGLAPSTDDIDHTGISAYSRIIVDGSPDLDLTLRENIAASWGWTSLWVTLNGGWLVYNGAQGVAGGTDAVCTKEMLAETQNGYLISLFAAP